jgi:hypothetical protein
MSTPALPAFANIGAVLIALETIPGVEVVPGLPTATNFILASEVSYSSDFEKVERNYMRPSFSRPLQRTSKPKANLTFTCEIMGSGVAIVGPTPTAPQVASAAPAWGVALQGCGMTTSSVITGNIGQLYTPTTSANTQKTVTIYAHMNGQLHKLVGSMGTFTVNLAAGEIGSITFTFNGNYVAPVVVNDPAIPAQTIVPPLVGGAFNFNAGTLINDLNAATIGIDMANQVVPRTSIATVTGIDGFFITGRTPSYTIDPERGLENSLPFYSNLVNVPITTADITVGTASGNRCVITLAKAQLTGLSPSNRDNMLTYDLTYDLVSDTISGNDELTFRFT